jgi:hypothetical protein
MNIKRNIITKTLASTIVLSLLTTCALADNSEYAHIMASIQALSFSNSSNDIEKTFNNSTLIDNAHSSSKASQIGRENMNTILDLASKKNIDEALDPLNTSVQDLSTNTGNAPKDIAQAKKDSQKINNLKNKLQLNIWAKPASDSITANWNYSRSPNDSYTLGSSTTALDPLYWGIDIEKINHDPNFMFSHFFDPNNSTYASTQTGTKSATAYIKNVLGNPSLYPQVMDLPALSDGIQAALTDDTSGNEAANEIRSLATSDTMMTIQESARKYASIMSMSNYTLNAIMAERSPIVSDQDTTLDSISATMGITPKQTKDKQYEYPSQMQMQEFDANNDLSNENWYKEVQTMSDTSLARAQLIMLKKINAQLLQNHKDSENIESLLAVSNAQSTSTIPMQLITEKSKISSWISSLDPKNITSPDDASTSP